MNKPIDNGLFPHPDKFDVSA